MISKLIFHHANSIELLTCNFFHVIVSSEQDRLMSLMRPRLYVPIDITFKHDVVLCKSNRLVAQFLGSVFLFIMLMFLFGVVLLPCVFMNEALVQLVT